MVKFLWKYIIVYKGAIFILDDSVVGGVGVSYVIAQQLWGRVGGWGGG